MFGGLLAWAEVSRSRLNDPDPAFQRTGFLLPEDKVRAPNVLRGYPGALSLEAANANGRVSCDGEGPNTKVQGGAVMHSPSALNPTGGAAYQPSRAGMTVSAVMRPA
ncbi:MAG: hypothetical protein ACREXM_15200 [Gammaproteobacteria bacterium]